MEVLHLHCPVKDCARFLFLGCSPMCLYFCLFKFRPELIPQTPLWRSVGYHCSTAQTLVRNPGWRAISILSPTAASIRWSLVMGTVGHSAPYRQELLLSTGSNLSVATGVCSIVWDGFSQRFPIVLVSYLRVRPVLAHSAESQTGASFSLSLSDSPRCVPCPGQDAISCREIIFGLDLIL